MQPTSPRQYFETRLRKLPVFKCMVNEDWETEKFAHVWVMRRHVNNKVSGANFLVDLLCLGVKDAAPFFNMAEDEMKEMQEGYGMDMIEISYVLAHNIVYAGLEFAAEYEIKPHANFAMAKYALEEDDDLVELIDIETGEDGIPHLIEWHPGQYADAHGKLKKHAGPGNFKVSMGYESSSEADETEYRWLREDEDEDWEDEEEEDISLKDIPIDDLTVYDAMMLPDEDLIDIDLINSRNELEQLKIYSERLVRLFETLNQESGFLTKCLGMDESVNTEVEKINELADENFVGNLLHPNGCDKEDFDDGMDSYFSMLKQFNDTSIEEKAKILDHLLQTTSRENPAVLAHCIFYLMIDENGATLYETLQPYIQAMGHYPIVALAQTFLVTAKPENFQYEPLLKGNSPMLQEVCNDYVEFSNEEFCLFYSLRCLQAAKQQHIPLMATWYRLLATTDEADIFLGMLSTLLMNMLDAEAGFLEKVRKWKSERMESE